MQPVYINYYVTIRIVTERLTVAICVLYIVRALRSNRDNFHPVYYLQSGFPFHEVCRIPKVSHFVRYNYSMKSLCEVSVHVKGCGLRC